MKAADLVTSIEAREILGVSKQRISQLVKAGKLKPAVVILNIKGRTLVRMFERQDLVDRKEDLRGKAT